MPTNDQKAGARIGSIVSVNLATFTWATKHWHCANGDWFSFVERGGPPSGVFVLG